MNLFTIGFTQKSAEELFSLIENNKIDILLDVRLNNKSQLAGFTKYPDFKFFLKRICNVQYSHDILFAPTKQLLDDYKKEIISWSAYEKQFKNLISERHIEITFTRIIKNNFDNICLLCSEVTAEKCHRRLVAEYLQEKIPNIKIIHI